MAVGLAQLALALFAPLAIGGGSQQDLDVRLELPPEPHEVGEPFEIAIVCTHPSEWQVRAAPRVETEILDLEHAWVVHERTATPDLAEDGRPPRPHGFEPGVQRETRIVYLVASLGLEPFDGESGLQWREERPLVGLGVECVRADEVRFVAAPDGVVRITGLLGPSDTAPRPLPGVVEAPRADGSRIWRRAFVVGGVATAVFAIALGLALRGNRVGVDIPLPPTRAERIASLRTEVTAGRADLRAAAFEAVALVRAGLAARGATADASLSDEEWRAAVAGDALAPSEVERLERFLHDSEALRFSPHIPTRWTVDDLLAVAERFESETQRVLAGSSEAED